MEDNIVTLRSIVNIPLSVFSSYFLTRPCYISLVIVIRVVRISVYMIPFVRFVTRREELQRNKLIYLVCILNTVALHALVNARNLNRNLTTHNRIGRFNYYIIRSIQHTADRFSSIHFDGNITSCSVKSAKFDSDVRNSSNLITGSQRRGEGNRGSRIIARSNLFISCICCERSSSFRRNIPNVAIRILVCTRRYVSRINLLSVLIEGNIWNKRLRRKDTVHGNLLCCRIVSNRYVHYIICSELNVSVVVRQGNVRVSLVCVRVANIPTPCIVGYFEFISTCSQILELYRIVGHSLMLTFIPCNPR